MFDKHFEVVLADTPESKNINYAIRYHVYCEEMGFENKEDFPLQMEFDDNDEQAVHFIVRDKLSGHWVGAMRLIYKINDALLPIEQSCKINEKIGNSDLCGTVELSRLCLIKEVRRRFKDIDPPHGIIDDSQQDQDSEKVKFMHNQQKFNRTIIWGLIRAAAEYCYGNNIHNWYFMTTNALAKVLRRGGLNLINIGEPCQHKGQRFPFKMDVLETYHSQIWQSDYNNGYIQFSKLGQRKFRKEPAAA